jgi:hypothetical protein
MLYPAELRARETVIVLPVDGRGTGPYSPRRMFRRSSPAWEVQVLRELLEVELTELRGLPYSVWRDVVGDALAKRTQGRDKRTYRVRIVPTWAREGSHDVRVTVALETPSLHRRLMRQSFVITPENQLRDS